MEGKILVRAERVDGISIQEAGFVDRAMVETLNEAVLLFGNLAVEDADLAIVPSCKYLTRITGMEVDCSNVVVVLGILPLGSCWLTEIPI